MPEDTLSDKLREVCVVMEDTKAHADFQARHGIQSASMLTVLTDEQALFTASYLGPRIEGKTIVEVGGGIGLLAFYLADYAERVFCIEANPVWSHAFITLLLKEKPKNLSYLLGAADEFAGHIKADVALFCTHSGVESLKAAGRLFAPQVIDVYGEVIAQAPDKFDPLARTLRSLS